MRNAGGTAGETGMPELSSRPEFQLLLGFETGVFYFSFYMFKMDTILDTDKIALPDVQVIKQLPDKSNLALGPYDQIIAEIPICEVDPESGERTGIIDSYRIVIEDNGGELSRRYEVTVPAYVVL